MSCFFYFEGVLPTPPYSRALSILDSYFGLLVELQAWSCRPRAWEGINKLIDWFTELLVLILLARGYVRGAVGGWGE